MDYDALSAAYARHRRASRPVVDALLRGAHLRSDATVLEIGCGTANHLAAVREAVGPLCVGVDPSAEMLSIASGTPVRSGLVQGYAERLPIGAGRIDFAFSVDVIHHVGDVQAYFREVARVLIPGGRVCTVTDSAATIRSRHVLSTYFPATIEAELGRYPTIAGLTQAAATAGLTVDDTATLEHRQRTSDASSFRDKAYSSLHLISGAEYAAGLAHLERDLEAGSVEGVSRSVALWSTAR